ncbi:MAG: hypothetical protein AAF846_14205 [Chloroflexota bacterium]
MRPTFRGIIRLGFYCGLFLLLVISVPTLAQDNSVTFEGEISEVTETSIVVGGVAVDISTAVLPVDGVTVGMTVQVIGIADGQTIQATLIVIISIGDASVVTPSPVSETATAMPTDANPAPTTTATVDPAPTGTTTPQAPIVVDGEPLIVIEGPVQAINITSITIFDIDIEVDPADEILTQIRIGDTIRVAGQSSFENNTVVIVAVNITVIQTTVIVVNNPATVFVPVGIPSNCRRSSGRVTCNRRSS